MCVGITDLAVGEENDPHALSVKQTPKNWSSSLSLVPPLFGNGMHLILSAQLRGDRFYCSTLRVDCKKQHPPVISMTSHHVGGCKPLSGSVRQHKH